jgi:hypothetical protein
MHSDQKQIEGILQLKWGLVVRERENARRGTMRDYEGL